MLAEVDGMEPATRGPGGQACDRRMVMDMAWCTSNISRTLLHCDRLIKWNCVKAAVPVDVHTCIWYLVLSTPTRIPSSMSVGATLSPRLTTNFAICLTLIMYFASSVFALMIFVHLATCKLLPELLTTPCRVE